VEGIELGLLVGIPMALGSTGLIVIGRLSDRSGDRRRWVVIGMLLGAAKDAGSLEAGLGVLACVLLAGAALASRLPFAATRPALEPSAA
jgi:MFS family permease